MCPSHCLPAITPWLILSLPHPTCPQLHRLCCVENPRSLHLLLVYTSPCTSWWPFVNCGETTKQKIYRLFKCTTCCCYLCRIALQTSHQRMTPQSPPPPATCAPRSALCLCEFDCFRFLIQVESCTIHFPVTGLFHLVWSPGSSMLWHMTGFPSF